MSNVGIRVAESGLWIVDVDPRNGGDESLGRLEALGDLPVSKRVLTGGGGIHVYLRAPVGEEVGFKTAKLATYPGIDFKATGMVVAPPSLHASGSFYRWAPEAFEHALAPVPEWLLELVYGNAEPVEPARGRGAAGSRLTPTMAVRPVSFDPSERGLLARRWLNAQPPAIAGQNGSGQTFKVACALVHGFELGYAEAWALLCEYSQRCEPPWSEPELRHKLEDATAFGGCPPLRILRSWREPITKLTLPRREKPRPGRPRAGVTQKELRRLPASYRRLVVAGPATDEFAGHYSDAAGVLEWHRAELAAVGAMVRAGWSNDQVVAAFLRRDWGIGFRWRQTESEAALRSLALTIDAARSMARP